MPTSKAFYVSSEDNPNMVVFHKLEKILEKIQDEKSGVPIRTVKTFMTKIPSVFTGTDLITWLMTNMEFSDINEALNLANRMASFGYFFPIDDHVMTVKNDNTYYRFQVHTTYVQLYVHTLENFVKGLLFPVGLLAADKVGNWNVNWFESNSYQVGLKKGFEIEKGLPTLPLSWGS